ncbi:MAG: LPS assembly lipoprotein LptE [Luteimonas sp.]
MSRSPSRISFRAVAAASLALLLAACGFQLRDALTLPPDLGPVRVAAADPYSALLQSLTQSLERAGATIADDGATDAATLQILSENWSTTPISVDQFGRAQEFSLRYAVVFKLERADGSELVPQQAIELSRDYVAPPVDSIGRSSEAELLARELRREMAASVLRRVDAVSREPGA